MNKNNAIAIRLVCIIGAIAAFAACPSTEKADFPGLWNTARLLAGISFIQGFLGAGMQVRAWRALALSGCFFSVLTLFTALGRCENLHLSPLSGATSHFFGIPSVLFFLAMAWARKLDGLGRNGRTLFLMSLVGGTLALFSPFNEFAALPIYSSLTRPGSVTGRALVGLTILGCLVSILTGVKVFLASRGMEKAPEREYGPIPRLESWGLLAAPISLALGHGLAFLNAPGADAFFPGIMLAALILHLTLVGGEEPDQWKKILSEIPPAAMKISGFLPPAVLLALYALLMTQSSRPIASDENIYFYMAKDFAEGAVPYRDFFFAHPPMKILLLAALFKLFGFSFTLAKLVSPVTGAATGFALWILCRQYFGGLAAFLAMTFFLLSNNCLSSTAFLSGAEMTTFFMAAAVLFSLRCRYYLAGFLFGLAALTGVYAAAGICAALALGFFRDARSGWKQFLAFTGVFVAGNLICWIAGGQGFLDGVYAYHGLKAFSDPRMHPLTWEPLGFASTLVNNLKAVYSSRVFLEELLFQPAHWMALAVAPIIYLAQFRPNTRLRAIPVTLIKGIADGRAESIAFSLWSIALAFVVQYAMFREQYGHYFLLIYPFLAALLGRQISLGFRSLGEYSGSGEGRGVRLGLFCLVSAGLAMPLGTGIFRSAGNVDLAESSIVQYEWKGLSGNKRLDDWVKALFWQSEWALYRPVPGYHSYLWSRVPFPEALPMAEFIKKNSTDGETLTGSSIIAPLLALLSGRKLAAGEIDTNAKRFMTGILDERRFWESVCADRLRYVVCDWNSHFTPAMMNTAATPKSWFHLVASGDELAGTPSRMLPVLLYERNGADDFDSSCAWVSP